LFRYLIVVGGIILLLGCSSNPTVPQKTYSAANNSDNSLIKLSHVRAYLLVGSIKQAQTAFDKIENKHSIPTVGFVEAELKAASGDALGAQQAFLQAIESGKLAEYSLTTNLLDYFCSEQKWPALQGYGEAIVANPSIQNSTPVSKTSINSRNNALTQISHCFFAQQRWDDVNYWLEKVDMTQPFPALNYLLLARTKVEQQQYSAAKELIEQYVSRNTEVDAKSLWTTIEVYRALNQPEVANKFGDHLYSLFPNNQYTRKYLFLVKREQRQPSANNPTISPIEDNNQTEPKRHIIKKGENLYQLSKRYGVTISELQAWNPSLVIDDISVGTEIQVSRSL
jgi:Tfp pilus assembly protein PilF